MSIKYSVSLVESFLNVNPDLTVVLLYIESQFFRISEVLISGDKSPMKRNIVIIPRKNITQDMAIKYDLNPIVLLIFGFIKG